MCGCPHRALNHPSRRCAVTCHTCHLHTSLIPSLQDSRICLPCSGAVLLLPGCLCARAPIALRVGAFMHPTPCLNIGGRAREWLHMAATAVISSDLNFRIIQVVIELRHLPVQGSSILFDLEDSLHLCQIVNFNFNAELHCCFSLSFTSILNLKDTGVEKRNWCTGMG